MLKIWGENGKTDCRKNDKLTFWKIQNKRIKKLIKIGKSSHYHAKN